MRRVLLLIVSIVLIGCASEVVKMEQARNPKCQISEKASSGHVVVIEIACPGSPVVEKTYHTR